MYNLLDDFYSRSQMDTIFNNIDSDIQSLQNLKLTTPVNSSGLDKIIKIDEFNVVSLIDIPGGSGSSLNYYTENTVLESFLF